MAITQFEYTGTGAQTFFSFPVGFEYIDTSEIIVEVDRTVVSPSTYTVDNTGVTFNTAPADGLRILITRQTDIDEARAVFYSSSAIRAVDLNTNFDQSRFSVQEWRDQKVPLYNAVFPDRIDMDGNPIINVEDPTNAQDAATKNYVDTTTVASSGDTMTGDLNMGSNNIVDVAEPNNAQDAATKNYVDTTTWNVTDETIQSGETWVGSNAYVATTQSIDQRIDAKIDTAITNDIGTDGTGITVTDDGDGTITLGLGVGSIDFDRIKDVDIITEAEQDAGSPSPADNNLFTSLASSKRFDTIVSDSTPVGSDWEVGKTWLQPVPDNTLSIWNGSGWIGVASGGTFLSQPTVIYVDSVNGNDGFDGHRIINPKRTIKNAVASANAGDIVYVVPGVYQEVLPIDITVSNLSIVGQSIRSCFIHPTAATETETMFRCNSGTYITGFTFAGLKATGTRGDHPVDDDPVYGLPANQGWVAGFYPGCIVKKSPYIQNCTNFADSGIDNNSFDPNNFAGTGGDLTSGPTGGGIFVDGSLPSVSSPLRSFVVDSFTQICLDGPGCLVANNGYAQLVSFFGTFCHYHTKGLSGGQVNLTNSTTDFGRYGLIADGKSTTAIFTATANGAASAGDITFAINQPVDNWFGSATRPLDNMMVQIGSDIYPILSSSANGLGWNVTISNPNPANRAENLGLDNSHANGAAVSFFLRSLVSTSGHTFEYAGSGTNYTALPENGGVADELKQSINLNEGRVWQSSTDQNGKFKVGDTFEVDQKTGFVTIDPQSYSTNLVSDLSPQLGGDLDVLDKKITTTTSNGNIVIEPNGSGKVNLDGQLWPNAIGANGTVLKTDGSGVLSWASADVVDDTTPQLGGDLDVQSYAITTSVVDGDIDLDANGAGLLKVTEFNLAQVPIVTQHDVGEDLNEIPLNYMLGTMAYQNADYIDVGSANIAGKLLVGTSTSRNDFFNNTTTVAGGIQLELSASNNLNRFMSFVSNNSDTGGPSFLFGKSRGTSANSKTIVQNDDQLAALNFHGADGSDMVEAARISAQVDGTPGANDMPGRLTFATTADGASSPTERMRINAAGFLDAHAGVGAAFGVDAHAFRVPDVNNRYIAKFIHEASGANAPYGINVRYRNISPNNADRDFIYCEDSTALKFSVLSNGGIRNYQSNNVNLSDEREKKNVVNLDSTWDCLKYWELKKFHYNEDDDTDDLRYGIIAQQVAQYCPEVISDWVKQKAEEAVLDEHGNVVTPAKEEIVRMGVKDQQMMWMAIKALQEAQHRIETLEAKVAALEGGTN